MSVSWDRPGIVAKIQESMYVLKSVTFTERHSNLLNLEFLNCKSLLPVFGGGVGGGLGPHPHPQNFICRLPSLLIFQKIFSFKSSYYNLFNLTRSIVE